jgi:hypothetical protein
VDSGRQGCCGRKPSGSGRETTSFLSALLSGIGPGTCRVMMQDARGDVKYSHWPVISAFALSSIESYNHEATRRSGDGATNSEESRGTRRSGTGGGLGVDTRTVKLQVQIGFNNLVCWTRIPCYKAV